MAWRRGCSLKKVEILPCVEGGGWVGVTLAGGRLLGSKWPIVHFGAFVNDPPKSIDLKRLKQTGLLSSGMIGLLVNVQLKVS
ncbi:hypothetical protein AVEN_122525-1 [Araneus ventricosus]|uniref:Uncharacterized protein n=1 Tax=Araneus ventricosus TaxID=182803 RepID=A0A4Y2JXZ7_ARAVE|nr:hypothetical protein AVEN_122525-1 [Araneus ventricosus]